MKGNKIILFIFMLILSINIVYAEECPWWNPFGFFDECGSDNVNPTNKLLSTNNDIEKIQTINYTPQSKTTCIGGFCNLIAYSNIQFVKEDNKWKDVKDAKSLKNVLGKYINIKKAKEKDDDIEVIDFNATDMYVCITSKNSKKKSIKTYIFGEVFNDEIEEYVIARKYNKNYNISLTKDIKHCEWIAVNIFKEKLVIGEEILSEKEKLLEADLNG